MVGGAPADITRVQPLFDLLARWTFHTGPVDIGLLACWPVGLLATLCNNMIAITTQALVAKAMVMGVSEGPANFA